MDAGRGEEFDELYAKERSKREESRRKRGSERHNRQGMKDAERINLERIRDVLRKQLIGEKSDSKDRQRYGMANYRSDRIDHLSDKSSSKRGMDNYRSRSDRHLQATKKKGKKLTKFQAKLRELSMSPQTKRKKELESLRSEATQEVSAADTGNLKKSSKTFATSLKKKSSSEEESKTGTESIKENRRSWLFKSPNERKKQLLRQQLELRRQLREQIISSRRRKLNRNQKVAANKLLASPKRSEESLLTARPDDTSTARPDEISTAHDIDQINRKSQETRKKRKRQRTARSIIEEDLKKRLQQMEFKLPPEKNPQTKSERSTTATGDRSPSDLSISGNKSVSGSRSQRELSSNRRMRHRKSGKRNQSQSQNQRSSDSVTANTTHIIANNQKQKQLKRKLAESGKEYSESEITQKIRVRRKLKNKKMISDERGKEPLKKIDNLEKKRKIEEQQNFTKPSNYQFKLGKKNQNQKEKFLRNEKNIKEEPKEQAKSMSKQSSKISSKISNKNDAPTKRLNQKSIKIYSNLSNEKFNDKKFMCSRKTTKTQKSTKSTTYTDSSKSRNEVLNKSSRNPGRALNNIIRSNIKETSDKRSSTSRSHSKRNRKSTKNKKHPNLINSSSEAIVSDKISSNQPTQTSGRNTSEFRKRKLHSSPLSNKSSTSETSLSENSSTNQKITKKFGKKPKIDDGKKSHWKKTTKSTSLERGLSSSSNGIYTSSSSGNSKSLKNKLKTKKGKNKISEVMLKTANASESPKVRSKKRQIWQSSRKKGHKLDSIEGEILKHQQMISNENMREKMGNNKSVEAIMNKYQI